MAAFFPALEFAWTFFSVLMALLLVAAYVDLRTLKIPKPIVFAILATGLLANLVRGYWLGTKGAGLFLFAESNPWLGLLDGFVFSLVGFVSAFAWLFVMWILKTCGGGDVKLMAALGAWLGPVLVFFVWFVSALTLILVGIGTVLATLATGKPLLKKKKGQQEKVPTWRLSYSLPVALATAAVLLWSFRFELGLAPEPAGVQPRAEHHAR